MSSEAALDMAHAPTLISKPISCRGPCRELATRQVDAMRPHARRARSDHRASHAVASAQDGLWRRDVSTSSNTPARRGSGRLAHVTNPPGPGIR